MKVRSKVRATSIVVYGLFIHLFAGGGCEVCSLKVRSRVSAKVCSTVVALLL